jgi:hypothetical protein
MYLLGQLEHGVYDDCSGWTLEEIEARYGVDLEHDGVGGYNEEALSDDDDDKMEVDNDDAGEWEEDDRTTEDLGMLFESEEHNIRHEPIQAPESNNPFNSDVKFSAFEVMLSAMKEEQRVPIGYGLLPNEWEAFGGQYQPYHDIPARNRTQELRIDLPHHIWHPRAILWAQGLMLMNKITASV